MARGRLTAKEQEQAAARRPPPRGVTGAPSSSVGEALAMLRRRGFDPRPRPPDLPFPPDLSEERRRLLAGLLGHYAFRLFLRGVMKRPGGLRPADATRYVGAGDARRMAEQLQGLGLAEASPRGRFRLRYPTRSFGATLEWYVAHELRHRLGFDTAAGVRFGAPGVGGDLDVVAAAEGKLVLLELKSSPPRQLGDTEVGAFFDRLAALRPDLALFVMDTALRLGDKVVPMLTRALEARSGGPRRARRVGREIWAVTPRLYAVGAKGALMGNVCRAVAHGFLGRGRDPVL
jgi:hypothetical protein